MAEWQQSKAWADQFLPHVKMLLGWACIEEAPMDMDRHENTDLMLRIHGARFAVRIRHVKDRLAYNRRNEVTFRCQRRSGIETEIDKLMNGWGDYCLYGWGDDRSKRVVAYTVLDLDKLRGWIFRHVLQHKKLPGDVQIDRDGSAAFVAFCVDCMPEQILQLRVTALPTDPPNNDMHWLQEHSPFAA